MSAELTGSRRIIPTTEDRMLAVVAGKEIPVVTDVPESSIAKFCAVCENLQSNNVCLVVGANDQGRYLLRKWCGWASVNRQRGQMTRDGFISSK